jgi:UDP-N-acetylmuramyl tripeptide synthase
VIISSITGTAEKSRITNLIKLFMSYYEPKISVTDIKRLSGLTDLQLKDYIDGLEKINTDILIIKNSLNELVKGLLSHINFDIMLFIDKAEDLKREKFEKYSRILRQDGVLINKNTVMIVNADYISVLELIESKQYYTVTYGYSSKAVVTASSVGDSMTENNYLCCIQKNINTIKGKIFEPQEFKIHMFQSSHNIYNILAAAAFTVVNGIIPDMEKEVVKEKIKITSKKAFSI